MIDSPLFLNSNKKPLNLKKSDVVGTGETRRKASRESQFARACVRKAVKVRLLSKAIELLFVTVLLSRHRFPYITNCMDGIVAARQVGNVKHYLCHLFLCS